MIGEKLKQEDFPSRKILIKKSYNFTKKKQAK